MAASNWRRVRVKVDGKMVYRWTNGKSYRTTKPAQSGAGIVSNAAQAAYNALGGNRKPSQGWKDSVAEQRRAISRGGQVRASAPSSRSASKPTTRTPRQAMNADKDSSYRVAGITYDRSTGRPIDVPENRRPVQARTSTRSPKPARSSSSSSSRTSSSSTRARAPQSKDMDANYKAWAKANPKLAAKVKKGSAGYDAIKGSRAASASDAQNLRSGRSPDKPATRRTSGVGPVKDGAKYARDIAKSGVRAGITAASKRDGARTGVRAGIRSAANADLRSTGPVKDGAKYAASIKSSRRLAKALAELKKRRRG